MSSINGMGGGGPNIDRFWEKQSAENDPAKLKNTLNDGNATVAEKTRVLNKLEAQLGEKVNSGTATEDETKQHGLLEKLKNGSIDKTEINQLASSLGTDAHSLNLLKGFGNGGNMSTEKNPADIK